MAHTITSVDSGSLAEELGIRPGEKLCSINGETIVDFLDYQALSANDKIRMLVRGEGGETEYVFEKDEYAPIGLNFATPMMSGVRLCANRCLFCFVDQLPEYARASLRVKDDDWRMSLMMGNYVTLTNVSDVEIGRIIRRKASPLYISVHAMDPGLRVQMLRTPRAARLPAQLRRLSEGGIRFHCQAVLCPGINDGPALERTIAELASLYPAARSLALVPVGLTDHREGLYPLRKYNRDGARQVLEIAQKWREKLCREIGTRFVFPSDELYLTAQSPIPGDDAYEEYAQIEDGVGSLRLLSAEFSEAYAQLPPEARTATRGGRKLLIACGVSAAPFLEKLLAEHPVRGADVRVKAVENRFFGPSVTVSGLVAGKDLVRAARTEDADRILITECMLREGDNVFLDDMTRTEAEKLLGRPVIPVGRHGEELLEAILENSLEA